MRVKVSKTTTHLSTSSLDCRSEVHLYDLFACIVHYGRAGSGHYITYALNSFDQQWYEYDDENVRQIEANTVQNAEAYVLFYRYDQRPCVCVLVGEARLSLFASSRKKESNLSETYEHIRHLLSAEQVRL